MLRRPPAELQELAPELARRLGAERVRFLERLQVLWGGYGELWRVALEGGAAATAIVKWVEAPARGSGRSHRRKLRSYEVERSWYRHHAPRCGAEPFRNEPSRNERSRNERCEGECRVPGFLVDWQRGNRSLLVLEDLDAAGYSGRRSRLGDKELNSCLRWLAHFHAAHLGRAPDGLWPVGTYWHLATRPEELADLDHLLLRGVAPRLDARLNQARFQTLVHGDAKVENFCFGRDCVAAVDFQYVGGGVGVKDVAYFLSSCLPPADWERRAPACLDRYFTELRRTLHGRSPAVDGEALEQEWRDLYPVAWADFYRFLLGWAPGEPRDDYSEGMLRRALGSE